MMSTDWEELNLPEEWWWVAVDCCGEIITGGFPKDYPDDRLDAFQVLARGRDDAYQKAETEWKRRQQLPLTHIGKAKL